jgi:hypothetical protein
MSDRVPTNLDKPADSSLDYAYRLAWALWEKHYKIDAPDWKPLPDLLGLLTQIDNMAAGLVRPSANGQTEER